MAATKLKQSIITGAQTNSGTSHNFDTGYGTVDASAFSTAPDEQPTDTLRVEAVIGLAGFLGAVFAAGQRDGR